MPYIAPRTDVESSSIFPIALLFLEVYTLQLQCDRKSKLVSVSLSLSCNCSCRIWELHLGNCIFYIILLNIEMTAPLTFLFFHLFLPEWFLFHTLTARN